MKYEKIKSNKGKLVFIRPALQHWSDKAKLERTLEDIWRIEDVSPAGVRLRNLPTDHSPIITLDRIHHFDERTPSGPNDASGTLILTVQLLFYKQNLEMEHIAPPGAALQRYTPTERRSDIFTKAAEFQTAREFEALQKNFESSAEGIRMADRAYDAIEGECKRLGEQFKDQGINITIETKKNRTITLMGAIGWWVSYAWQRPYANTLKESSLRISRWDGHPEFPDVFVFERPTQHRIGDFTFRLVTPTEAAWVEISNQVQPTSSSELVEWVMSDLLNHPRP